MWTQLKTNKKRQGGCVAYRCQSEAVLVVVKGRNLGGAETVWLVAEPCSLRPASKGWVAVLRRPKMSYIPHGVQFALRGNASSRNWFFVFLQAPLGAKSL
jgi:hypothetical protein